MKRKIYTICTLIVLLLSVGCSQENDLEKYGIVEKEQDTIVKSEEDTNKENVSRKEQNKKEQTKKEEVKQENKEVLKTELKYKVSELIPVDLSATNETYITSIVDILNDAYYLGINRTISNKEKDEIQALLDESVSKYMNFLQDSKLEGIDIEVNGYTADLGNFVNSSYYYNLDDRLETLESDDMSIQKEIAYFIAGITMEDYFKVVDDRSELMGKSIYSPNEIKSYLFNNEEISTAYINEEEYEKLKYNYDKDFNNTMYFKNSKFLTDEKVFQSIEGDIDEYFETYKNWIDSFIDGKTTIDGSVRYYYESNQMELYEQLKQQLQTLDIEIEKICNNYN